MWVICFITDTFLSCVFQAKIGSRVDEKITQYSVSEGSWYESGEAERTASPQTAKMGVNCRLEVEFRT